MPAENEVPKTKSSRHQRNCSTAHKPVSIPSQGKSCERCRQKKIRCSRDEPACSTCHSKVVQCIYNQRRPRRKEVPKREEVILEPNNQGGTPGAISIKWEDEIPRDWRTVNFQHGHAVKQEVPSAIDSLGGQASDFVGEHRQDQTKGSKLQACENPVASIEQQMNLLEQEGGNIKGLPEDWEKLPSHLLHQTRKETERVYRLLLREKIEFFGGQADPETNIDHLEQLLDDLRY